MAKVLQFRVREAPEPMAPAPKKRKQKKARKPQVRVKVRHALHGQYFASRGCTHVWSGPDATVKCEHLPHCWKCRKCGTVLKWHGQKESECV